MDIELSPVMKDTKHIDVQGTIAKLREVLAHLQSVYSYHITVDGVRVGEKPGDLGLTHARACNIYKSLASSLSEPRRFHASHSPVVIKWHGDKEEERFSPTLPPRVPNKRRKETARSLTRLVNCGAHYELRGDVFCNVDPASQYKPAAPAKDFRMGFAVKDPVGMARGVSAQVRQSAEDKARELEEKRQETARLLGGRVFG